MAAASPQPPVRVVLIGRAGCHLCDTARETVRRVTAELGVGHQKNTDRRCIRRV